MAMTKAEQEMVKKLKDEIRTLRDELSKFKDVDSTEITPVQYTHKAFGVVMKNSNYHVVELDVSPDSGDAIIANIYPTHAGFELTALKLREVIIKEFLRVNEEENKGRK